MTTETAPPTSAQGPSSALATTQQQNGVTKSEPAVPAGAIVVRGVAHSDDRMLERIEATITVPEAYQYGIPIRGRKLPNGAWDNDAQKVGITSDGYDYLNRVIGCTFSFPEQIHDENGNLRPNPIHRPDYIYMRVCGIWRNPVGQLVAAYEDVEVDFRLMYQNKRANALSAKPRMGDGGPLWDEAGNMVLDLSADDELKAYRELTQNRSFGPRYAITVGRIRLLKMATGIRSMPYEGRLQPYPIRVVGYRDMMTPQQRIAEATGTLETLYGARPADIKPLTADEAVEAGLQTEMDAEEAHERAVVAEAQANQSDDDVKPGPNANAMPEDPSQVPWTGADLEDLGLS